MTSLEPETTVPPSDPRKPINPRTKGAGGERELAKRFVAIMERVEAEGVGSVQYSTEVKRNTLQSDRGGFDLVGVPLLAVECKRCEKPELERWWKQATGQAKRGELPVVLWRQNRGPWRARTYVALTSEMGVPLKWTVADLSGDAFFDYFETLYRGWLQRQG
jgi:hypothetical protein